MPSRPDADLPFAVTVSETRPTRREVVAPERSIGSGRYGALRDHDDKHRDNHPDQSPQHGSHALPKTKPWYATGAALVTAGALALVGAGAAVFVAVTAGAEDPASAEGSPSPSLASPRPTAAPSAAPATPTPVPTPSTPSVSPTPAGPQTVTVLGTLQVLPTDDTLGCFYFRTAGGRYVFLNQDPDFGMWSGSDGKGGVDLAETGVYPKGAVPSEGPAAVAPGGRATMTGIITPGVNLYESVGCPAAPGGSFTANEILPG